MRLGCSLHDVYKYFRASLTHARHIKIDPDASTNQVGRLAYGASFIVSLLTLVFLAVTLVSLDQVMLRHIVSWMNTLDMLRIALGLTSVVRILIIHAETRTLVLNAGFFTYMYGNGCYKVWLNSEVKLSEVFTQNDKEFDDDEAVGDNSFEGKWPLTSQLYETQKAIFAMIAGLALITYYLHVYKQA